MAIKTSDFRDKLTLYKANVTVDSELNRTETLTTVGNVWCVAEVRNSAYDGTPTGERAETRYRFTVRRQPIDCDYVGYKGMVMSLLQPYYDNGNYTIIDAVYLNR